MSHIFSYRESEKIMSEWKEYHGTDEQIAEMRNSRNGWIFRLIQNGKIVESYINRVMTRNYDDGSVITHYWIIPDDPLREMKIRQAQTGQPVWIKQVVTGLLTNTWYYSYECTNSPNWNIPNAEYSFTSFEE